MSDTPIQWPFTHRHSSDTRPSLIVCGDMVKAIEKESASAVAYHFGVTAQTVTKWRKALGVDRQTPGTLDLPRRTVDQHFNDETRAKVIASTKRPERNAKIAAARRGKPRPPHVQALLRRANAKRTSLACHVLPTLGQFHDLLHILGGFRSCYVEGKKRAAVVFGCSETIPSNDLRIGQADTPKISSSISALNPSALSVRIL